MPKSRHFPNLDRISILAATILLAYILTGFVSLPSRELSMQLPGIYLSIQLDVREVIAILIAALTATGADWLVREHPALEGKNTFQHWLLPALTAWAIGTMLYQQPFGVLWWIVFSIGGLILILVLIAEYIVVDTEDIRHVPATIGLTAISFALYLTLTITIRAAQVRLFLLVPAISIAIGLTCLRTLHLRLRGQWAFVQTAVIALIIGQIAAALNYLPLRPITFGLALFGPAYALPSLAGSFLEEKPWQGTIVEPILVLCVVWGIALWIR
ncbi:MAG: hypothetical protein ABIG63_05085 [Chloroflexota bacterium]